MTEKQVATALTRSYPADTVLFEEHDPGSRLYVIRSGRVKIFRRVANREVVLAVLGAGEFFGEMALLENLPRSASAQTMEETTIIEVDAQTFEDMIRSNIEIAVRIMRKLASRVRELDRRLQNLLVDSGLGRAVEVLRWLLPQGVPEGDFIRLKGATAHVNIAAQAGISPDEAVAVLQRLRESGCLKEDGSQVLIAKEDVLDAFSTYLDLKRKFDPDSHDLPVDVGGPQKERQRAMTRLLAALNISPDDMKTSEAVLSTQYRNYLKLRQRFEKA
jgi:CRP/FNR family transcriptional regulator, cyclic AMP receptor protein